MDNAIPLFIFAGLVVAGVGGVYLRVVPAAKARKAFWTYLSKARTGGFEDVFMARVMSRAVTFDALDDVVERWGRRGIERVFLQAQAEKEMVLRRPPQRNTSQVRLDRSASINDTKQ
jgi:hypothetical protein